MPLFPAVNTSELSPSDRTRTFRRGKHVNIEDQLILSRSVNKAVSDLYTATHQAQMVSAFSQIAKDHSLSAPVVAVMRATPGFLEATAKFPKAELFNIVPEHKSSTKPDFVMAMESFGDAETTSRGELCDKAGRVVEAFDRALTDLKERASALKEKIEEARKDLSESKTPEEVHEFLEVTTLSNEAFDKTLGMIEKYLTEIDAFETSEIRNDPEKLKEEIDGLVDIVGDVGRVLGLDIDSNGVTEGDKDEAYKPRTASFEEHDLSKSTITFYIDKAASLLDLLEDLGEKKDYFVDALREEAQDIPEAHETEKDDDEAYTCHDHVCLMCSYVCLITKLVDETIIVVSRLISVTDKATENDEDYEPANEEVNEEE